MTLSPTPEQRAVVDFPLRPLRVTAGAGTGKTTTMALRLASLVAGGDVVPEEALGITFTNKAAAELAARIRSLLPDHAAEGRGVEVSTYHGFAHDLLREFGAAVGVERDAVVVTPGYARQLLRDALGRGTYEFVDVTHAPTRVDDLATLAGQLGDNLRDPASLAAHLGDGASGEVAEKRRELAAALVRYRDVKQRLGAVDFSDLIRLAFELLDRRPEIARMVRARYRVVLLDEYQDTNPAQRELLRRLFGDGFPVTAVGDPDQTIYEWRGASRENFAKFPDHFGNDDGTAATTLPLSVNRRSAELILDLADRVREEIGDDQGIDRLVPGPDAGRGDVTWGWFRTSVAEANRIAGEVRSLHDDEGVAWRDMAILFRKNAQIGLVRDALELEGVPVEVASLGGLLGVPEVAELHAWLRIIGKPDDSPALARILLGSRYRLGLGDLRPLAAWGSDRAAEREERGEATRQFTLLEAVFDLDRCPGLSEDARGRLDAFAPLYRDLLEVAQGVTLVELCRRILDRTGAWPEVEAMDAAARLSARLNLYRFLDLAEEWSPLEGRPSLDAFLDYLELLQEDRAAEELDTARLGGEDAVALLTVHRAKGLEWPVVFLPALCDGTFPAKPRRLEDPTRFPQVLPYELRLDAEHLGTLPVDASARHDLLSARHQAQEWRTAYVAITRAQHRLYCTGAFWYTERKPKERSPLLELATALPGAACLIDTAEPGEPPDALRLEPATEGAPDPHFPDGWRAALRATAARASWPEERAQSQALSAAYHARVEQLRIILDGLPDPPPTEPADEQFRTSVTGLVTYATCPLRFRWSEVDRLPRRSSAAARRGVDVHRRIELHNRGTLALEDADEGFYDLPGGDETDGADAAGAFATFKASRFAATRPHLVEAPFDLEVGTARVRGRIDAIYQERPGEWEIVDFKSGRPKSDPAARVQLEAYAVAAHDVALAPSRPERVKVTFAFLGDGLHEVTEDVDEAWMTAARQHLAALVGEAERGEFAAAPGAPCRGCDFLRFCEDGTAWIAAEGGDL